MHKIGGTTHTHTHTHTHSHTRPYYILGYGALCTIAMYIFYNGVCHRCTYIGYTIDMYIL